MKTYGLLGHSLNGKGATNLQKVLEMRISLVGFTTKRTSLHHHYQCGLKLKVSVRINDVGASSYVSSQRGGKLMDGLVGHSHVRKRKGKGKDRKGKEGC